MSGMNERTGKAISDDREHIQQSIARILTTPVGSRVKRRTFGSLLPELIDHPGNPANQLRMMAATYMAIIRWEPRIMPTGVMINTEHSGRAMIDIQATMRSGPRAGSAINLSIPIR